MSNYVRSKFLLKEISKSGEDRGQESGETEK